MFSETAIEAKNISKYYQMYKNPKDRIKEFFSKKAYHEQFWALKDISFSIKKGEVIGIIGKNGSGKSTLLKIVSKILKPSEGTITIKGNISPILELGMGFDPNLSGTENIYLSATLLGLSKKDIELKLEEIINFSELGNFIHQPVKTYSSGMYVRLAFSIATSVDPEILVVDEALSVGDSYFQKKSLNRILDFKSKGKTILFCSHNMYQITHLCDRVLWIDSGELKMLGNSLEVTEKYEEMMIKRQLPEENKLKELESSKLVFIKDLKVTPDNIKCGDDILIEASFVNKENIPFHFAMAFEREDKVMIFSSSTYHDKIQPIKKPQGIIKLKIKNLPILSGKYNLNFAAVDETATITYDCKFGEFKISKENNLMGLLKINHEWSYDD